MVHIGRWCQRAPLHHWLKVSSNERILGCRKQSMIPWSIIHPATEPIADRRRSVSKSPIDPHLNSHCLHRRTSFILAKYMWVTMGDYKNARWKAEDYLTSNRIPLPNPRPLLQHTHSASYNVSNRFHHRCRRSHRSRHCEQAEARGAQGRRRV